jgi:hypothetical protein
VLQGERNDLPMSLCCRVDNSWTNSCAAGPTTRGQIIVLQGRQLVDKLLCCRADNSWTNYCAAGPTTRAQITVLQGRQLVDKLLCCRADNSCTNYCAAGPTSRGACFVNISTLMLTPTPMPTSSVLQGGKIRELPLCCRVDGFLYCRVDIARGCWAANRPTDRPIDLPLCCRSVLQVCAAGSTSLGAVGQPRRIDSTSIPVLLQGGRISVLQGRHRSGLLGSHAD